KWVVNDQVVKYVTNQDNVLVGSLTDHDTFKVGVVPWQDLIEHNASQGGLSHPGLALGPAIWELRCLNCFGWTQVINTNLYRCLQTKYATVISHDRFRVERVHVLRWAIIHR